MTMTKLEILGSFKRADDKKAQMKILSELNACSTKDIRDILISAGLSENEVPKVAERKKKSNSDTEDTLDKQFRKVYRNSSKKSSKIEDVSKPKISDSSEDWGLQATFDFIESLLDRRDKLLKEINYIDKTLDKIVVCCKGANKEALDEIINKKMS